MPGVRSSTSTASALSVGAPTFSSPVHPKWSATFFARTPAFVQISTSFAKSFSGTRRENGRFSRATRT